MSDNPATTHPDVRHPASDSHGVPWRGRTLSAQPFAGDDGSADPALTAAIGAATGVATGVAAGAAPDASAGGRLEPVIEALRRARVLVPIVATVGEEHPMPDHLRGDAGADMSLPLLAGPDGARALPVFTGLATLGAWDARARPVPVSGPRAALSAVDEGCVALVLDPGAERSVVIERPALWALAQGRAWRAPYADAELTEPLRGRLCALPEVSAVRFPDAGQSALVVEVELPAGLDAAVVEATLGRCRELLATPGTALEMLTERVDRMHLTAVPAGT